MKRLLLAGALFALTALLVSACTSPTDVDAGRKVTKDPIVSSLSVQQDVDFGTLKPNVTTTFLVEIRNTSATESVNITDIRLKDGTKGFQLSGPALPITLGRKGKNDVISVPVVFSAALIGEYRDEIIINNDPALKCKLVAVVLNNDAVIVNDADFGSLSLSLFTKTYKMTQVINNGDASATIVSAAIQGADAGAFILGTPLPLMIPAGGIAEIMVIFDPNMGDRHAGQYTGVVEFNIEYSGSGTVDNISLLTGEAVP
jgi:hypothetical protein